MAEGPPLWEKKSLGGIEARNLFLIQFAFVPCTALYRSAYHHSAQRTREITISAFQHSLAGISGSSFEIYPHKGPVLIGDGETVHVFNPRVYTTQRDFLAAFAEIAPIEFEIHRRDQLETQFLQFGGDLFAPLGNGLSPEPFTRPLGL